MVALAGIAGHWQLRVTAREPSESGHGDDMGPAHATAEDTVHPEKPRYERRPPASSPAMVGSEGRVHLLAQLNRNRCPSAAPHPFGARAHARVRYDSVVTVYVDLVGTNDTSRSTAAIIGLRAPRVALLFRADEHWRSWASLALYTASQYWGGEGYVLIPYDQDGSVHPALLTAVSRFDPDFIAVMSHSPRTWLQVAPEVETFDAGDLAPEMLDRALDTAPTVHDPAGRSAAESVAARCSPLAYTNPDHPRSEVQHFGLGSPHRYSTFRVATQSAVKPRAWLAGSCDWTSPAALWAAAKAGIADLGDSRPAPDDKGLLRWCAAPHEAAPPIELVQHAGIELSDQPSALPTWFRAANPDLGAFRTGYPKDGAAIVIGDEAADFALAMLYDRTLGFALWLTTDDSALLAGDWIVGDRLRNRMHDFTLNESIAVHSASLEPVELAARVATLIRPSGGVMIDGAPVETKPWLEARVPDLSTALLSLMISESVGETSSVAANYSTDGTIAFASDLITAIPADPPLSQLGSPAWVVDVRLPESRMPTRRRVGSHWLSDERGFELIRSARDGITFHSASHGFVPSGAVLKSRLARPHLRFLGLSAWIEARARDGGLETRLSRPGQNAALVARRLGGRAPMIDLLSGALRPALRYLAETGKTSGEDFPDGDGVVVAHTRFVTFDALVRGAVGGNDVETRRAVDELLTGHLLRRGLILDCPECHTVSFIPVDELGQSITCARCEAINQLVAARWKATSGEPRWFYDLHPALADLFRANGDVSTLAAQSLSAGAREYDDLQEVEFADIQSAESLFELDLVAHVDGELIVVEAKSNGSFGNSKERHRTFMKRFEAATLLGAGTVVFATTGFWSPEIVAQAEGIRKHTFPTVSLRWLSGLGDQEMPTGGT